MGDGSEAGDQFRFPLIDFTASATARADGWGSVQIPLDRLHHDRDEIGFELGISSDSP